MIPAIKFSFSGGDPIEIMEQSIFDLKVAILQRTREKVSELQGKGVIPTDNADFSTLYKNSGRAERKINIDTFLPRYVGIGTPRAPTRFRFIAKGSDKSLMKAAISAYNILRKRTARHTDSGTMLNAIEIYLTRYGNYDLSNLVQIRNLSDLRKVNLPDDVVIILTNTAVAGDVPNAKPRNYPYPIALEANLYMNTLKKSYPGKGIFFHTARAVQSLYKANVSCRFKYMGLVPNPTGRGKGVGALPVIEIGRAGLFPSRNVTPGKAERKRRRKAKKANR